MEDNQVHQVADQLGSLTAQSPTVATMPQIPCSDLNVINTPSQGLETAAHQCTTPRRIISRESSALTEIDDAIIQEMVDPSPESQRVTDTHLIDPVAPLVSYDVSDVASIIEQPSPSAKRVAQPLPPAPTSPSFERYLAQSTTPSGLGSPMIRMSLSAKHIMGLQTSIPAHILESLEYWHGTHRGSTEHPCATGRRAPSTWGNFKVFDEDASEYGVSTFQISLKFSGSRGSSYHIMVLCPENGPEELVCFSPSRPKVAKLYKGLQGVYLLVWIDAEERLEPKTCAIKVWRTDKDNITFDPRFFDPEISTVISPKALGLNGNKGEDDGKDDDPFSSDTPFSRWRYRSAYSQSGSSKMSLNFSGTSSPVMGSPFISPNHDAKRAKINPDENNIARAATPFCSPVSRRRRHIRFKLVSTDDKQSRFFDTDNAKTFFKKAHEFFHPTPAGFLCYHPNLKDTRYIGDSCADEFNILVSGINLSTGEEEDVIVVMPSRNS